MSMSEGHYLYHRVKAYTWTSLVLGPLAIYCGAVAIWAEWNFCSRRACRERVGYHAVAISEILSGVMQFIFGILYLLIVHFDVGGLEDASEAVNAVYVISVIFSTSTIMQISYQRWIDVNQVRVGGVRPLEGRHWFSIVGFTAVATAVVVSNKIVYGYLKDDKDSQVLKTAHTLTYMAIGLIWLIIFIACTIYNIRIIRIARQVRFRRRPDRAAGGSTIDTRWIRLTLFVYNTASILLFAKIVDGVYLTEAESSYPPELHIAGIVNHVLQTTALLALPVFWLAFCTHFTIDFQRSRARPLS